MAPKVSLFNYGGFSLDMHDFGVDHPGAVELEGGEGQLEADLPLVGLDSRLAVVEEAEGEDQDYRGDAEPHDLKRGGVVI